jgi:hypothetical protein
MRRCFPAWPFIVWQCVLGELYPSRCMSILPVQTAISNTTIMLDAMVDSREEITGF